MSSESSALEVCPSPAASRERPIDVSLGIFAYNEERLIRRVVDAFLSQRLESARLKEVVVDASGSWDRTVSIVRSIAARHPIVELRYVPQRLGKSHAINSFLERASGDALVIAAGDAIPNDTVVETLTRTLAANSACGMAGPRPMPHLDLDDAVARMHCVLWELHHSVALQSPKLGEVVAFRRGLVSHLPPAVFCDEVVLEAAVLAAGQEIRYVPEVTVENFPPRTLPELYRQRRRIHCQHVSAKQLLGYAPSTFRLTRVLPVALRHVAERPRDITAVAALSALELVARAHGRLDYARGQRYASWSPVARPSLEQ
jgi:poly-beta-1,6-N-acetyl-D-glucosamine synthase